MKKTNLILMLAVTAVLFSACESVSYKKTATGLVYKLIPGKGKDSIAKLGNVVKFNYVSKLNDSVLFDSYGKVPGYVQLTPDLASSYNPVEALFLARKGDSLVTISMVDTLINKGLAFQLPPGAKKGDRMITSMRVLEIFEHDSLARTDYNAELEKDKPRRDAEMKETQAKAEEERNKQMITGTKAMEDYLKKNNITAQKTGQGTYVVIKEKGSGEPVVNGKFLTIKYTGRLLDTGKEFESSTYIFQIGAGMAIMGWDEGLLLFNKGGKGTLYIPGFLAYGPSPGPGNTPWEALVFDVEVLNVTNTREEADAANAQN